MNKTVVYLAGKMSGLTREEMTEWRIEAEDQLNNAGMSVLDPTRTILCTNPSAREIVVNNKFQINHSNIVLAEIAFTGISLGTMSEIVYAGTKGKPVISWGKNEVHKYPWISEHTVKHFITLGEALEYIVENYSIV